MDAALRTGTERWAARASAAWHGATPDGAWTPTEPLRGELSGFDLEAEEVAAVMSQVVQGYVGADVSLPPELLAVGVGASSFIAGLCIGMHTARAQQELSRG